MAFAWSLPTGFNTPITYFYVSYFAVLLIHRQLRDDEHCQKKYLVPFRAFFIANVSSSRYGEDWVTYKKLVPWRIVPYIY